jgi:pyruvate formate lyase activating enzyme
MNIAAIRQSSFIDYSGYISAVIFFKGCNFSCPYCHNSWLLDDKNQSLSLEDIYNFLEQRTSKLDGVVFSGGEPTIQKNLIEIIRKVKEMGFLVKLDTNGYEPDVLNNLLRQNLLNYIAMDIKGPLDKYDKIANKTIDVAKITRSIALIKNSGIEYEFRTTLVRSLLTEEDIMKCGRLIQGAKRYYLQKFNPETVLDEKYKRETTYKDSELQIITKDLLTRVKQCEFR